MFVKATQLGVGHLLASMLMHHYISKTTADSFIALL